MKGNYSAKNSPNVTNLTTSIAYERKAIKS